MKEVFRKLGAFFLDIIQTIVLALSIFVIIYLFLLQPHQVRGNSMVPNFHDGEFLLTDKISYRFGEPNRGDVVVFRAPSSEPCAEQECEYIKRILGLPQEKIKIEGGYIYVNGQKINETYLPEEVRTRSGSYFGEGESVILKEGEYLVAGDNRSYSRDSREFGPIKKEAFVGRAWLRYWPANKLGLLPEVKY